MGKKAIFRLVHFQVNLIPNEVMGARDKGENNRPDRREAENHSRKRQRLNKSLAHAQLNAAIGSIIDRLVVKNFGVLTVVQNGMPLECCFEGSKSLGQKTLAVHQFAMHLMLNKRH